MQADDRNGGGRSAAPQEPWQEVLDFWFPEEALPPAELSLTAHREFWVWRMRGGAHNDVVNRYADLTAQAAAGQLDHWAVEPAGRLALIIVLDQFSRSVWRESAQAWTQDPAALALTEEGLANGHYASLRQPWRKIVFGLPFGHCEGADHLARVDRLIELRTAVADEAPVHLAPIYRSLVEQAGKVRRVVAAFGRHPHRNELLGRRSTPEEAVYLRNGQFPHLQAFDD